MTLKGVYKDGMVILRSATGLNNGDIVEVTPATRRTRKRKTIARRRSAARSAEAARRRSTRQKPLPAFGAWKDRADLGSSGAEASLKLRRQIERRGRLA
jgi:hypothetical protein